MEIYITTKFNIIIIIIVFIMIVISMFEIIEAGNNDPLYM